MNTFLSRFRFKRALFCLPGILVLQAAAVGYDTSTAKTPLRPLPRAQNRDMTRGPGYFVDAQRGNDRANGSQSRPWQSINHALNRLSPGDTLYLRGGTYYERVKVTKSGDPNRPITLRAFPNELVVLDGGIQEFHDHPAGAWEPYRHGVEGEFRSTREYAAAEFDDQIDDDESERPKHTTKDGQPPPSAFFREGIGIRGWFSPSMVPVRGYMLVDFRSDNLFWGIGPKYSQEHGFHFGPGVWYDRETRRIHIRLSHTKVAGITNYAGETDPRKIPMVIAVRPAEGPRAGVLNLQNVRHVRLQDLVIRGSVDTVINIENCEDIELEHLTVYGAPGISIGATNRLRVVHTAFRGLTSPWESRASMKYRGGHAYIIRHDNVQDQLTSRDWELANCEFTDSHDCIWMLGVKNLRFHHNFVDNFNDDGLEIGPKVKDQEVYIYENLISRCNGTLAVHGMSDSHAVEGNEWKDRAPEVDPASGVYIYRNVFDLRRNTYGTPPRNTPREGDKPQHRPTKMIGEHGTPAWPQIFFYHNAVLHSRIVKNDAKNMAIFGSYGFGIGVRGATSQRRVYNNIFVQTEAWPGRSLNGSGGPAEEDRLTLQAGGNLFWAMDAAIAPQRLKA